MMNVVLYCCLFFSMMLGASLKSSAQLHPADQYVVKHWGMNEGLPQSSVNDIIQTKDGYIWLATFGGLVRFDGVAFTTFNRSNTPQLRSDRVLILFEDNQGALWFGTEDGFMRYKNEQFKEFMVVDDNQVFSPSMISQDTEKRLWFSANNEVYYINNDSIVNVPVLKNSNLINDAKQNKHGTLLAFQFSLVKTLGNKAIEIYNVHDKLTDNLSHAIEYPANSGNFFYGSNEDGVFRIKDEITTHYTKEDGLPSRYSWFFRTDLKNNLWVLSFEGLSLWTESGFVPFSSRFNFDDTQIRSITEDRDGTYWVGTLNDGLYQLKPTYINAITSEQGLKNELMLSLTTLQDGRYVFATNCGGIYEWDGNKVVHSEINQHLPNLCIWSVFQDSKSTIWMGSRILYQTTSLSQKGRVFTVDNGFKGYDIYAISEDSKGQIWIGCFNGTYIYNGTSFEELTVEKGLSYNDTRVFFEDDDGTMWIGTTAGLNTFKDGITKPFPLLTQSNGRSEPYIRAIHKDSTGTYWIGTYGSGLFRIKNGEVHAITVQNGLFDNVVSHLKQDAFGYLWSGSNRGVFRMNINELNAFCDGTLDRIYTESFGIGDGMKTAETNGGFQPNVIQDKNGLLYFPTVAGITVINPASIRREKTNPLVYIEKIHIDNSDSKLNETIVLPFNHSYLEIDYTALNFREPDKLNFSYRLEGITSDWLDAGKQRSVIFTQLPPGEYTFQVTANTGNTRLNPNVASIGIVVIPPFWDTPWFYTLVSILLFGMVYGSFYVRVRLLKKENEQQKRFAEQLMESQESERRRIATELHDGLGQQILIIKNRAELAGLVYDHKEQLLQQLEEIKQSATSSISDVRNIAHNLRPVHLERFGLTEALEYLCDEILKTTTLEFGYHIEPLDGLIPKSKEINFYRVIQEGIQNIIKHAHATEASLFIRRTPEGIRVQLWDDGKGFAITPETMKGIGFLGMHERIELMNGKFEIDSTPGNGTTLRILIPVSYA